MLPPEATLVTVLRHGAVAGRAHVLRGALDEPLAETGWTQMHEVLRALPGRRPVDAVATSPLRRCRAFAETWAGERGLAPLVIDAFRERAFGAWEGMTPAEAEAADPAAYRVFQAAGRDAAAPGGEHAQALRERVAAAWAAWLADAQGGHRLLVTHAGVMRALLVELLGLPFSHVYRLALPEAAHFQVSVLAGEPAVLLNLNPCAA
ncbi:MAG: histidine phosphatase family protein [Pseudomonadota bacterium]